MRKLVILLLAVTTFSACEKRNDPFEADNTYPVIRFKSINSINSYDIEVGTYQNGYADTVIEIYDTIKNNFTSLSYQLHTTNEGFHIKKFIAKCNNLKTDLKVNGILGNAELINTITGGIAISLTNHQNNPNYTRDTVLIKATDFYNKSTTIRLMIFYIDNFRPYARFTVEKIGNVSDYEIRVDASDSYDSDARYGGQIVSYFFDIDGYTVENDDPILNHILPGPGTYTVKVKVKDNNGLWSQEVSKTITLD